MFSMDTMQILKYGEFSHCVKSVQIRSFSGPNTGKYGPEKTLFSVYSKILRFIQHLVK